MAVWLEASSTFHNPAFHPERADVANSRYILIDGQRKGFVQGER
jgi:hypothetical protein